MSIRQETADDIIAEMLGARTEFPFVYLMGEPDTPEVIDPKTKEIIAPRKINIRRVTVQELAHRLKAALKRESGDAAKLREALTKVKEWMEHRIATHGFEFSATFPTMLEDVVLPALAAPPRNCDVPYNDRVEMYGAFKDWCNVRGHTMNPKLACDAFDWLLAPATEQKGENNER